MRRELLIILGLLITTILFGCSNSVEKQKGLSTSTNNEISKVILSDSETKSINNVQEKNKEESNQNSNKNAIDNSNAKVEESNGQKEYYAIDYKNIPKLSDDIVKSLIAHIWGGDTQLIEKIDIRKIEPISISRDRKGLKDYLVEAYIEATGTHSSNEHIAAILVRKNLSSKASNESYELKFESSALSSDCELIDVDSDGGFEILIKESHAINGGFDKTDMNIYKYKNNEFESIFNEGLSAENFDPPYCYNNSYKFVKNRKNPKYYDIIFNINTQCDKEFLEDNKPYLKSKIDEPVKDEIIFSFNGVKYIPKKQVYDYKKYLKSDD